MILVNYTPDDIKFVHGGIPGTIEAGGMEDMPEAKARFILNKFDQRGLLSLVFGDNTEVKKKEAIEIYKDFWGRQVQIHNQANEARQVRRLEYSGPSGELKVHAKALNLKLLGPWTAQEDTSAETTQLKDLNTSLMLQVSTMTNQFQAIMGALQKQGINVENLVPVPPPPVEPVVEPEKIVSVETKTTKIKEEGIKKVHDIKIEDEVKSLTKKKFVAWVMNNAPSIMNDFDSATQAYVREQWKVKGCSNDWPLPV